jgi:subtilisin
VAAGAHRPQRVQCSLGKGLLLVAAAGNNGGAVGQPASYKVIAVSAIDSANAIASFSSRGPKSNSALQGRCARQFRAETTERRVGQHGLSSRGGAAASHGAHRYSDNVTIRRLLAWTQITSEYRGETIFLGTGESTHNKPLVS